MMHEMPHGTLGVFGGSLMVSRFDMHEGAVSG